jgi:hypothetical protein
MHFVRTSVALPTPPKLKQLSLNGKRFYQLPCGDIVPSVTTLLGSYEQVGINRWKNKIGRVEAEKISNEAKLRGENFHILIDKYLQNVPIEDMHLSEYCTPDLLKKLTQMKPCLDRINNIYYQETQLGSKSLRMAGRCDVIAEYDGILSVIDFKTARKPKLESYIQNYFEQTTCYGLMFTELTGILVDQVVVLISADGRDEPQEFIRSSKYYNDSLLEKIHNYEVYS